MAAITNIQYNPTISHVPGAMWTIMRFNLMQHKRVIPQLLDTYHFYFNESLIGYTFVQTEPLGLMCYIRDNCIPAVVIFDSLTGEPAVLSDSRILLHKRIIDDPSTGFSVMPHPLDFYAQGHEKLICVSGPLSGYVGYIVRVHRDRKFVFAIGRGITFGVSAILQSKFLTMKEYDRLPEHEKFAVVIQ